MDGIGQLLAEAEPIDVPALEAAARHGSRRWRSPAHDLPRETVEPPVGRRRRAACGEEGQAISV